MIYLIGGPPKCGKTTLAKKFSQKKGIPWVSSDTLETIAMHHVQKYAPKKFAALFSHSSMKGDTNDETYSRYTPQQIAKGYITQAKATYGAVDMFSICEIKDSNDYIIEGYHITPQLAAQLIKKYGSKNFRVLFLVKEDTKKFVRDIHKSTTPNDWILKRTKKKETFSRIAEMISCYGKFLTKEAKKYGFSVLNVDVSFDAQLKKAATLLHNSIL